MARTIQTFTCPKCGQERSGVRRRCYACTGFRQTPESIAKIRATMTGVKHPPERVLTNSLSRKGKHYGEAWAAARRGHPAPNEVPIGHRRIVKDGKYWQVKCPDGRFRYEHRVLWETAHGPLPVGYAVHHVNHDGLDNRLENLIAITPSDHGKHHATPERMRAQQLLGVAARKARSGHY